MIFNDLEMVQAPRSAMADQELLDAGWAPAAEFAQAIAAGTQLASSTEQPVFAELTPKIL